MRYQGSCHCGQIKFDVDGTIEQLMECNCSLCSRRATLLWFVPRTQFHLNTPESAYSTYTFNKHRIKHHFCPRCGCTPFSDATDPQGNPMVSINTRCLENVDLSSINVVHYDGLHR